jgi:predicted metal-dependent phosphoesterase TrpH
MDVRTDLHLHTTASDGCWSPEQLITEIRKTGIGLFAVTDHDSLGSLSEVAKRVRGSGLRFLPGVELSVRLDGQVYHLLGYGFDPADPALNAFVEANGALLAGNGDEAIRLLASAGYAVSLEDYDTYRWDRGRGGWKSLNYLIDRGMCHDVSSYMRGVFGELGHPQAAFPTPEEAIAAVHRAGGVVVLAHPGAGFYNDADDRRLDELVEMGLQGLECYSFHHTAAATERFLAYCDRRRLLITGGSDCHGGFVGRPLGQPPISASDLRLGVLQDRIIV